MILTRKPFVTSFLVTFFLFDIGFCQSPATPGEPEASTVEPDAAPGCKAPQIRINPPPAKTNHVILEAQVVEVETTPSYLSEDLATTDAVDSFVETINLPPENTPSLNPYQIDGDISAVHELSVGSMSNFETSEFNQDQRNEQQINKKRRAGSGRRRRKENDNGQGRLGTGGGNRGARYRRKATWTTESPVSTVKNVEIGKWKEKPIDIDDTYFIDVSDLYKTKSLDKSLKKKLRQKWKKAKNTTTYLESFTKKVSKRDVENVEEDDGNTNIFQRMANLFRVKRKSGKTTGALSRPKAGGDSGSKSTSRKGDKGGYEEEGYSPIHPEEEDEEEEEEEEDLDAHHHFGDVSEIRFPGEVGPLGDPRLCKIRCIKGKWVGPLCATNEENY